MECNKDEAARAKYIAGEKMKAGDFVGAQKLVSKAQRLFPDLENIEQMITICDVQTSAEKKICGLDNWYAILQVQHFDDAITIKKQYRKLALLLHPDKNKFAGAEAAFKWVGEAYRLLYDQVKRSQYDVRYRSHSALANSRSNAISGHHCAAKENVATVTFWTCCNHCGHRYKYLKEYMNNVMHCSSCQKSYIACSTERDGVPRSSSTAGKVQFQDQSRYTTFQQYYMASTGAESRTSKAETDKNVSVGRKLNKKNQGNQKKVAADWKPMKDEGCAGTDAEVENPQKSETSMDNSAEIPKGDFVLKPQPEVKEAETGMAKSIPDLSAPKKKQAARKKRKTVGESTKSSEVDGSDVAEAKTDTKEVKKPEIGAGKSIPDLSAPKKKQAARKKRKTVEESTSEVDGSDVAGAKTDAKEVKEPETGAGKSIPDLAAPKKKQAAKKKTNSVEESTKSSEVDASDVNGATTDTNENSKRKSSRKKPQVSNTDEGSSGDFVSPPTKKTRSGCEFESDSNAKQTTEDNTSPELADSGISPAASHACEGKNKQSKGCEANGEDAALSSKNDKVDNGEKANGNPNTPDIPVSEFIVFENERKIANFAVKQVWSIRDSRDGMPRKYVQVKKVLTGEFKLQITYLDPIQDDSIPVACGEFKKGETEEIMDSSVFSSQMDYSVSNRTFSIFPKKGEIWALFREWNKEWDTSLEKHELPYKYDFVQVLSDFHNVDGVGVAYLGKLKGFVSLFHFEAQNGVCQIQFIPEEIGRFSHKVPAVQMNGQEGKSVPPGSYELEPVALPRYIFQDGAADMEMDSEILKDKPDSPYPEAPQVEVKSKPVPETAESAKKRRKPDDDDSGICINLEEAKDGTSKTHDFSSCQVDEKKTRNEFRKNGGAAVVFYQRKSPRLQKNPSPSQQGNEVNTAKKTDKGLVTYSLGNRKSPDGVDWPAEGQEGESSKKRGQRNSQLLSMSKQNDWRMLDGSSSRNHSPETTLVSTSCKTPQRKAFDFKSLRSEDKFRANQIWAVYSNDKGMPTEYVKIKKIVTKPQFKLHVAYMELFTPSSTEPVTTRPVSCGEFKLKTGKPKILPQTSFSHQINPDQNAKKNIVEVYPNKGEVWALHKNSSSSNTEEHEIVEVVEEDEEIIKAVPLMALTAKGSNSLYETTRKKGSNSGFIGVPKAEMIKRFSHQIPAFRHLTRTTRLGERGCWELDPRAIPGRTILLD